MEGNGGARFAFRRSVFSRSEVHADLLQTELPGAAAVTEKRGILSNAARSGTTRLSSLFALGIILGIDLIQVGFVWINLGLALKRRHA